VKSPFKEKSFVRVNMCLTKFARLRLQQECDRRDLEELGSTPMGKVISELIMAHLPPHPSETPKPMRTEAKGKQAAA
jgi:hypothetical protein